MIKSLILQERVKSTKIEEPQHLAFDIKCRMRFVVSNVEVAGQ